MEVVDILKPFVTTDWWKKTLFPFLSHNDSIIPIREETGLPVLNKQICHLCFTDTVSCWLPR